MHQQDKNTDRSNQDIAVIPNMVKYSITFVTNLQVVHIIRVEKVVKILVYLYVGVGNITQFAHTTKYNHISIYLPVCYSHYNQLLFYFCFDLSLCNGMVKRHFIIYLEAT